MSYSSGGGSSDGGTHGGGDSHSGVSYSLVDFEGALRFRYFLENGEERYIYSREKPKKKTINDLRREILFMLPFIIIGLLCPFVLFSNLKKPTKLTEVYSTPVSYIDDSAEIIKDEAALNATLKEFQNLTGICPYVVTIQNSEWQKNGRDFTNYALQMYRSRFNDEQHFLIVYSQRDNELASSYGNWFWEGVQGDETNYIISEAHFQSFSDDLHENLKSGIYGVEGSINMAFRNSLAYMMDTDGYKSQIVFSVFFVVFWNGMICLFISKIVKSYKMSQYDYVQVQSGGSGRGIYTGNATVDNASDSYYRDTEDSNSDRYNGSDYDNNRSNNSESSDRFKDTNSNPYDIN